MSAEKWEIISSFGPKAASRLYSPRGLYSAAPRAPACAAAGVLPSWEQHFAFELAESHMVCLAIVEPQIILFWEWMQHVPFSC